MFFYYSTLSDSRFKTLQQNPQRYDLYSMVTGLFLTGLGIYFFMKGKKREEAKEKNN
ncbi:TPA: DUF3188 domain-containing protein [Enterococcus faecium]